MKRAVIIVAAGSGSRMGGKLPKQYLKLSGKPLIIHTLDKFQRFDPEMKRVIVLAPEQRELWDEIAGSYEVSGEVVVAHVGATRYDSVKNGLAHIEEGVIVGIHDAVRPFVSHDTLKRGYESADRDGSGIPVVEMEESVRMIDHEGGSASMDRTRLKRVQTPQVFRSDRIKQAYRQPYNSLFTDDASVYEALFGKVVLVQGNRENIKITTPIDMKLAELLTGSLE